MQANKKIGIIGGVGPQATQFIYGKIIQLSQSKYHARNNDDYPRVLIDSVPIPDFISDTTQVEPAKDMLVEAAHSLVAAGATKLCIGSNTVHILLDTLKKASGAEFLSMIELVAKKCLTHHFKKVGLMGTPVLLKSGIYDKELQKHGIEIIHPTDEQIAVSDTIIRHVLAGQTNEDKKQEYIRALNDMFDKGAQAIILGCTELPLAINYEALGSKMINSDEVLAEGIVDYYYT